MWIMAEDRTAIVNAHEVGAFFIDGVDDFYGEQREVKAVVGGSVFTINTYNSEAEAVVRLRELVNLLNERR